MPKPGEYKFMTQGIIRIWELMTAFTVLTNEGQEGIISNVLMMLKAANYNKKDLIKDHSPSWSDLSGVLVSQSPSLHAHRYGIIYVKDR